MLDYLGGSYVITRVLRKGRQETENEGKRCEEEAEVRVRWGHESRNAGSH